MPCFDIRQQCVGFLYGLQLVDAHIRAGLARTVLLVGAEIHSGFMPYSAANWEYLYGRSDVPPTPEEWAWNTRFRHLTVLFGDAGAAVVIKAGEEGERGSHRPAPATRTAPTTTSSTCPAPASSTGPTPTPSSSRAATTSR